MLRLLNLTARIPKSFSIKSNLSNKVVIKRNLATRFNPGQSDKKVTPLGYFLLLIPLGSLGLGCWQIQRKKWKEELIKQLEQQLNTVPVPLPDEYVRFFFDDEKNVIFVSVFQKSTILNIVQLLFEESFYMKGKCTSGLGQCLKKEMELLNRGFFQLMILQLVFWLSRRSNWKEEGKIVQAFIGFLIRSVLFV